MCDLAQRVSMEERMDFCNLDWCTALPNFAPPMQKYRSQYMDRSDVYEISILVESRRWMWVAQMAAGPRCLRVTF